MPKPFTDLSPTGFLLLSSIVICRTSWRAAGKWRSAGSVSGSATPSNARLTQRAETRLLVRRLRGHSGLRTFAPRLRASPPVSPTQESLPSRPMESGLPTAAFARLQRQDVPEADAAHGEALGTGLNRARRLRDSAREHVPARLLEFACPHAWPDDQ